MWILGAPLGLSAYPEAEAEAEAGDITNLTFVVQESPDSLFTLPSPDETLN